MPRRPVGSGAWRWTWRWSSTSTGSAVTWLSHQPDYTHMKCTWTPVILPILVWPACSVSKPLVWYCLGSKQDSHPPFSWRGCLSSSAWNVMNVCLCLDVPVESLRLRFALLQSLNNTLESFFLPLVELRQTQTYQNSIAALLCEAKGEQGISTDLTGQGDQSQPWLYRCITLFWTPRQMSELSLNNVILIRCYSLQLIPSSRISAGYRSNILRHEGYCDEQSTECHSTEDSRPCCPRDYAWSTRNCGRYASLSFVCIFTVPNFISTLFQWPFALQVRSDHQRTHISARQHVSCPVCHRPSSVWNWPAEETQPTPLTSASLERKFMAQVAISLTHRFPSDLQYFTCHNVFFKPNCTIVESVPRRLLQTLPMAGV